MAARQTASACCTAPASRAFAASTTAPRRKACSWRPAAAEQQAGGAAAPARRRGLLQLLAGGMLAAGLPGGSRSVASAATGVDQAAAVLEAPNWPEEFPFKPEFFQRYDESSDAAFYETPRYVTHIDDGAIKALTQFYAESFPASGSKDAALLDICSSWISHYPDGYTAGRVAGLGMNEAELARNKQLTEYAVRDLNEDPSLPYEDNSFDMITNAVSVDYLAKPIEVFREMHRCLKPGGTAIMSFSNRCFPTKAIAMWTSTGDLDHIWIVGSYFHYSVPGGFTAPQAKDISPRPSLLGRKGDPMYVVFARKAA
ncbi:S-adenosyl-L-methionine-dependent methyltransferase [Micractinium conductrix]|uniref:S-adenosyl-L-methionine-dependent methyltransferase n=1 Tax=Micractinium conductrix TaxID=554055 RepID=A0A2P6V2V4_9CHLO|nr:S-adenosyl-L-methionine-dependent methyltransferase [Micractinium conductrix]|eukprot:PSC68426.1 S-adenosyl-L-methionine-dependent methyltransferase [Micractinium conductrix]